MEAGVTIWCEKGYRGGRTEVHPERAPKLLLGGQEKSQRKGNLRAVLRAQQE